MATDVSPTLGQHLYSAPYQLEACRTPDPWFPYVRTNGQLGALRSELAFSLWSWRRAWPRGSQQPGGLVGGP